MTTRKIARNDLDNKKKAKNDHDNRKKRRKKARHDLDNKRPSAVALAGVFPASTTLADY